MNDVPVGVGLDELLAARTTILSTKRTEAKEAMKALADDLQMFASQVREAMNGEGDLPTAWRLDDITKDYAGLREYLTANA